MAIQLKLNPDLIRGATVCCIFYNNDVIEGEVFYYNKDWSVLVLKDPRRPDADFDSDEPEDENVEDNMIEIVWLWEVQDILVISNYDDDNPPEPIPEVLYLARIVLPLETITYVYIHPDVIKMEKPKSLVRRCLDASWKMCVKGFNFIRKKTSNAYKKLHRTLRSKFRPSGITKKTKRKRL